MFSKNCKDSSLGKMMSKIMGKNLLESFLQKAVDNYVVMFESRNLLCTLQSSCFLLLDNVLQLFNPGLIQISSLQKYLTFFVPNYSPVNLLIASYIWVKKF